MNLEFAEDAAIVDIPHGLVVPHFGSKENRPQHHSLPANGVDLYLSVVEKPLQVDLPARQSSKD